MPVLLTSGYPDAIQRVQAMGAHFLQKPYDLRQLADALGKVEARPDAVLAWKPNGRGRRV